MKGRADFQRMLNDIQPMKDEDVLYSLHLKQDYGRPGTESAGK